VTVKEKTELNCDGKKIFSGLGAGQRRLLCDRYAKSIVDELERIADLLEDLLKLEGVKLQAAGFKGDLPERARRRPNERRSARDAQG
jgi:hypothetical protein